MLTPVDVQNKSFKGGIGFDKKEVENFMSELSADYEMLYRSNVELKDKVTTLNESLQHYRSIEDSMQKALTLSEKTAEETINAANDKARQITTEAEKKAETILANAKEELSDTKNEIYRLQQQHAKFKAQFTKVLESQLKIMDGEMVDIDLGPDFEGNSYGESGYGNFSGGGLGSEGGLGGLGGGYVGSGSEGFERTNQDPAFSHGTLNMDPFADATSGGGRFSRQTGGAYNGNSSKKSTGKKSENKSSLNVKQTKPGADKVKKNFNTIANDSKASTVKKNTAAKISEQVKPEPVKPQTVKPQAVKSTTDASTLHTRENVKSVRTTGTMQNMQTSADSYPNRSTADAKPKTSKAFGGTLHDIPSKPQRETPPVKETVQVSGEVEDRINESTMLDSEDNYNTGFDFVEEESATSYEFQETSADTGSYFDSDAVSGEVEDKINESTMLDSEDNYSDGFNFVVGNEEEEEIPTISQGLNIDPFHENKEEVFTGDVEDNLNKSTLIGNADNDDEGFNFL